MMAVKPATPNSATMNPASIMVAEVLANDTVARIGPNSNYHRVTPLLKGIKAAVVGSKDGDNNGKKINWIQLDYGGWVSATDLKIGTGAAPKSTIQNIRSQNRTGNTDVIFAVQAPVPLVIDQTAQALKLTFYNTTAPNQSNNIVKLSSNPIVD
jgi:N-acetylmuramoyl-L-alanine amidase